LSASVLRPVDLRAIDLRANDLRANNLRVNCSVTGVAAFRGTCHDFCLFVSIIAERNGTA
jgi:hypothetical protein